MKLPFSILGLLMLMSACQHEYDQQIEKRKPLAGLWKLHIMEIRDSATNSWTEWRGGMQGFLLYDQDQNMALHLTAKGYEQTNLRFPNFSDTISLEALKHLTNSYVYMARYEIDTAESIVQHSRFTHSNPGDWNKVVRRRFHFNGDTLVLQPAEKRLANLRLKWLPINDTISANEI